MFQIASFVETKIDIKKSRFIGQLYPVYTREEAKKILYDIRKQHPNAVHFCWVLLCDGDSGLDDDGEPSGTAAKPMYNVLVHKNLFNVLAVVIRYWGGIKLGAGGLARAYGQAISDAFLNAKLLPIEVLEELRIAVAFSDESQLRHLCELHNVQIKDAHYSDKAVLHLSMKENQTELFEQELTNILRGNYKKISSE
jgi:uncharacterized YigZ family protein